MAGGGVSFTPWYPQYQPSNAPAESRTMVVHPSSAASGAAGGVYISFTMMALSTMRPCRCFVVIHSHARGE